MVWWILVCGWNCYEYVYNIMLLYKVVFVYILFILKNKNGVYISIYEVVFVDYVGMVLN